MSTSGWSINNVTVYFMQVAEYKRGKTKVFNFFVGQVQKELDGRADGKAVVAILQRCLSSDVHNV